MRCVLATRLAIPLLLSSFVSDCSTAPKLELTPKAAVRLPAAPAFMGPCPPSGVTAGMAPNEAFDLEHAAYKGCSRRGDASLAWYRGVRKRYSGAKL